MRMTDDGIIAEVVEREGGWKLTNRKADKGGLTFGGMTWDTFNRLARKFRRFEPMTQAEFKHAAQFAVADDTHPLRAKVRTGYRLEFIEPYKGLPEPLRLSVIDYAVNTGPRNATKALQSVVDTMADGIIGPITLRRARDVWREGKARRRGALLDLAAARADYYARLVRRRPSDLANIRGWLARTFAVLGEMQEIV